MGGLTEGKRSRHRGTTLAKANPPEVGGDRKSEDFNVTQGHTEISGNAIRNMRQAHSRIPDKLRHSIINSVNDIAFCLIS